MRALWLLVINPWEGCDFRVRKVACAVVVIVDPKLGLLFVSSALLSVRRTVWYLNSEHRVKGTRRRACKTMTSDASARLIALYRSPPRRTDRNYVIQEATIVHILSADEGALRPNVGDAAINSARDDPPRAPDRSTVYQRLEYPDAPLRSELPPNTDSASMRSIVPPAR